MDDDNYKLSAVDLDSMNGEPTPTSSINLTNINDISMISMSNNS